MSIQLNIVNTMLRALVKPTLSITPLVNIRQKREFLKKVTALIPAPQNFYFNPIEFDNFNGEEVRHHHISKRHMKVILYFPGGAYVAGSHFSHRNITSRLSHHTHAKVVAINYRKAPEHPYPYPVNDAISAYRYLLDKGYAPENISFAGDSAGGNLVLSTLVHLREHDLPMPSSAICISAWTDISSKGESVKNHSFQDPMLPSFRLKKVAKIYANGLPLTDPRLSPLYADTSGFPPILFHVGSTEILLSDSVDMHEKIITEGGHSVLKVWKNAPHVFPIFAGFVPQSSQSLKEIASFIATHWKINLQVENIPDTIEEVTPLALFE